MVKVYTITLNDPGGYAFNLQFQTDQDLEEFIVKLKPEAERRGYELILRKLNAPGGPGVKAKVTTPTALSRRKITKS